MKKQLIWTILFLILWSTLYFISFKISEWEINDKLDSQLMLHLGAFLGIFIGMILMILVYQNMDAIQAKLK